MYWSCLCVVFTVLFTSFLSEGVSYVLVYRTKKFKILKNKIEAVNYKMDQLKAKQKTMIEEKEISKNHKMIESMKEKLKMLTRDLYFMQMPSNFFLVLIFVSAYGFLSSLYDAYVVAQLPFEPLSIMTRITHRTLPGNNKMECSMTFLLVLSSMCIRTNVKKYLGFAPNVPNPWMPPMQDWDEIITDENEDNSDKTNEY